MAVTAVLFAAGRGTRLRPISDTIPKPALPLLDVPLGAYGLVRLGRGSGTTVVNVSHLADEVVVALGPHGSFEALVERPEPYGSAGTVAALLDRLADTFVTLNSDVLIDLDPDVVLQAHRRSKATATVVVRRVLHGADMSVEGDRITGFIDRRDRPDLPGVQFLGLAVFEKRTLASLSIPRPAGLGETVLAPLAESGALNAYIYKGYYADVGTLERYHTTSLDLLAGKGPRRRPPVPGRIVALNDGAAYVGPGADVEETSLGPGAIVLAGATVHPAARIARAIVMPHERVGDVELHDSLWHRGAAIHV